MAYIIYKELLETVEKHFKYMIEKLLVMKNISDKNNKIAKFKNYVQPSVIIRELLNIIAWRYNSSPIILAKLQISQMFRLVRL